MIDGSKNELPETLPTHPFFEEDSYWSDIGLLSSYYCPPAMAVSKLEYDRITCRYKVAIRSSIKNYHNEIDLFIDWITPYIEAPHDRCEKGVFIGYSFYEESTEPALIYVEAEYDDTEKTDIVGPLPEDKIGNDKNTP